MGGCNDQRMEFMLDPPHGIGPLRLGMTSDEARAALEAVGPLARTAHGELAVHLTSGLGFSVGFGVGPTRDRVNAIEVWRPHEHDVVRYRDVDVFGLPALVVVDGCAATSTSRRTRAMTGSLRTSCTSRYGGRSRPMTTRLRRRATSSNRYSWPVRATATLPPRPRPAWPLEGSPAIDSLGGTGSPRRSLSEKRWSRSRTTPTACTHAPVRNWDAVWCSGGTTALKCATNCPKWITGTVES